MKIRENERHYAIPGTSIQYSNSHQEEPLTSECVWDISSKDCGFLLTKEHGYEVGDRGRLDISLDGSSITIDDAVISRKWEDGVAVTFSPKAQLKNYYSTKKQVNSTYGDIYDRKKTIALSEIGQLASEIRELKKCEVHIFLTCLTLSVAFFSLLIALSDLTSSRIVKSVAAIGPAFVAFMSAAMAVQKGSSINRAEAYLILLKQQLESGIFYPAYRGWEESLAIFQNCKNMECGISPRCIDDAEQDTNRIEEKVRFNSQSTNYSKIMLINYGLIYFSSIALSCFFLVDFFVVKKEISFIFLLAVGATLLSVYLLYRLKKLIQKVKVGQFCILNYYNTWRNIFTYCSPFGTERLK